MRIALVALLVALAAPVAPETPKQPAPKPQNPYVAELLRAIDGKEKLPSGEVFRNVQLLKDVPALRLLAIMEMGYSAALGVGCEHCHVVDRWEADEKRPKRAAREMILLSREINTRLKELPHIDNTDPFVNCMTCHRGKVKPNEQ